jgi:Family of unknown function (DUF6415)
VTTIPSLPVDAATMRATTARLLADGAERPSPSELAMLVLTLRGHLHLLIPEVERAAESLKNDQRRVVLVAGAVIFGAEARRKLAIRPRPGLDAGFVHARRLARSVDCLLEHLEKLRQ